MRAAYLWFEIEYLSQVVRSAANRRALNRARKGDSNNAKRKTPRHQLKECVRITFYDRPATEYGHEVISTV